MRASPINLSALGAAAKIRVINFCERFELINDLLADVRQDRIAMQTARERRNHLRKIEAANYLDRLLFGNVRLRTTENRADIFSRANGAR